MEASLFYKNKMPLSDRILHTCVGHPTYLDLLPGDVLRFCLMPFLGWEDRIHVNMLTPPGDRTPPKRIPKDRIIANQLRTCVPKMMTKLKAFERLSSERRARQIRGRKGVPSQMSITEAALAVLRCFKIQNYGLLLQYNSKFRDVVIEKMNEFSHPGTLRLITRVAQRNEMISLVNHILQYLSEHPYSHDIPVRPWLHARVTQNETNLQCGGWLEDGTNWHRVQGDIYSAME
ncbi:MAG: hypothetical protein EB015_15715 [Methylocystaceae bacterium]|nr:hypothetical protein [Methylocystaceae bacterium]